MKAKLLGKVHMVRIVRFHDAVLTKKNVFLIFEYCNGGDLVKYRLAAPKKYLSEDETRLFMKHICNGYKALLAKNIIHRDLKPHNIFLHEGEAKIGDFGTSKHFQPGMDMTLGKGTPLYMCREVMSSKKYDEKCDVWSLGIMIYELLYGVTPWTAPEGGLIILYDNIKNIKLEFPKIPKRTAGMKALLMKMLKVEPIDRCNWNEIFETLNNFEGIPKEINNDEKAPIKEKKTKKKIIGQLNNFEEKKEIIPEKKMEKKPSKTFIEKNDNYENFLNETLQTDDKEKKGLYGIMIEKKEMTEKNKEEAKKYKNNINFYHNLSNFFSNCSFLFDFIHKKQLWPIKDYLYKKIISHLNLYEAKLLNCCYKSFLDLKKMNILSLEEIYRLSCEISMISEEKKIKKIKTDEEDFKKCLQKFLKKTSSLIEDKELLKFEEYDEDFFKMMIFFILILKAEKPEELLKDEVIDNEDKSQLFYQFYDKYDNMERDELIEEIRSRLKDVDFNFNEK